MKYTDRITKRFVCNDILFYDSNEEFTKICAHLGFYEDTGLSPLELADTLIQGELFKPKSDWDMDKIEKWQAIKENYLKYIESNNTSQSNIFT